MDLYREEQGTGSLPGPCVWEVILVEPTIQLNSLLKWHETLQVQEQRLIGPEGPGYDLGWLVTMFTE